MIRALVVDDEEPARRGIVNRLARMLDIDVVGVCRNGREALDAIARHAPDLVFLDVQMPGRSGLDVIRALGVDACPLVIFVTAHDEYALRAFDVHALDYVLKPIDDERFAAAVERARRTLTLRADAQFRIRLTALLGDATPAAAPDQLVIRSGGRIVFVAIDSVDWIAATGDYVTVHSGEKALLMRETIGALEARLAPRGFVRIHRSTLVNRDRIAELRYLDNGDYRVLLRNGNELKLSRTYQQALQQLLAARSA
jgi:two-component system LytT family response regulator